ncbi:MAG: hypothetical protein AB8H79_22675 [Myxococcota bacterium]
MLDAGKALTAVPTADLVALLRALHRIGLTKPFDTRFLAEAGLLSRQDSFGFLTHLDEGAAKAVLVAVIAERRQSE